MTVLKENICLTMILLLVFSTQDNLKNGLAKYLHSENTAPNDNVKKEVPVLCYHQIRDWKSTDSQKDRTYILPVTSFAQQIQKLHDSGYNFILPDQLIKYLENDDPLPSKPVLITFDDGTISQFTNAVPILEKEDCKAVFFIMTVALNKPGYMSATNIKQLSDKGFVIGCHTWDHHDVTKYSSTDWRKQLVIPTKQLETVTGRTVSYFAYPNGTWDTDAINVLESNNYKGAFQLSGKVDPRRATYTVRRIIVDGHWNAKQLVIAIEHDFK